MIRGEIRRYHVVKNFYSTGNTGYAKRKEKSTCNLQGGF